MQLPNTAHRALDEWVKVLRFPIDSVVSVLPNGSRGPRNAAMIAVDRADASIRAAIGGLLKDNELIADAQRRRVVADERERAISLRIAAETKQEEADDRFEQKRAEVDERRETAERAEAEQKAKVERQRVERERKAEEAARAQKRAADTAKERRLAAADERAKRERLKVLAEKTEALDSKAKALTVEDEAQRLRKATSKAKAARKTTS